ncbi:MAG TPA: HEAT repeat domain-containing protein, partial [Thermoguttaceae bacterium]|nr:HEAT repeat domain-containing protein [Thermoguttaceae bacterium]
CPYCFQEVVYEASAGGEVSSPHCFGRFRFPGPSEGDGADPGQTVSPSEDAIVPSETKPVGADPLRRWIWILSGLALFLVGLIAAVAAGRYVRTLRTATPEGGLGTGPSSDADHPAGLNPYAKWIGQLQKSKDPVARSKALEALVAEGPEAVQSALDVLVQTSEDGNVFQMPEGATSAWVEMGSAGVETLLPALQSEKANVRAGAAYVFSKLGGQAKPALASLADRLQDPHPRVRWYALEALAGIGPAVSVVLDKIAPLLEHSDRLTRRRAVLVLARIGPKAKSLLPQVQKLAKEDPDASVRQMAELAARQLNLEALVQQATQEASEEIKPLIERLQGGNPYESVAAAEALAKLGPKAADALPALALALYHQDKWVREAAAKALGAIGREARAYRDALAAAALDAEPEVRQAAQQALDQIDGRKSAPPR